MLNSLFRHWSYRIFAPGTLLRRKYQAFKTLLQADGRCHELMADFQALQHEGRLEDRACTRARFSRFSAHVLEMIEALNDITPGRYALLRQYHKKFDFYTRFLLAPPRTDAAPPYVFALADLPESYDLVGNKAKNLAHINRAMDIAVPRGFAVSATAFHRFIAHNHLRERLDAQLAALELDDEQSLEAASTRLMQLIREAECPPEVVRAILENYDRLEAEVGTSLRVAVRSSAICEDDSSSFAGQYTSLLNRGRAQLIDALKEVYASKYTRQSLSYRIRQGLGDEETAMAVLVVEMLQGSHSGILYTRGVLAETAPEEKMHLHITRGLGEQLAGGRVTPAHCILSRSESPEIIFGSNDLAGFPADTALALGRLGLRIENHFKTPQDIEWTLDSTGVPHILQARPLRISQQRSGPQAESGDWHDRLLMQDCQRASSGVAAGEVFVLRDHETMREIPEGAVLVIRDTPAELVQVIGRVRAVVAEKGSRASHFATVAREFGIPLLVGIDKACEAFTEGLTITVDGNRGVIYRGRMSELIELNLRQKAKLSASRRTLEDALVFITPLELVDPEAGNFTPEGCRSMHDIIRFCHEKGLQALFSEAKPGTGLGARRLSGDIPLDVYLFDIGGGIDLRKLANNRVPLPAVTSPPFQALWRGLSHPEVQWKQKPFDWDAYDKVELAGGVAPRRDSFAFASYAVVGIDYLHFNIRFGYHFTIIDTLCGSRSEENHCMLRFAGGGGEYRQRLLRLEFIALVLRGIGYDVSNKGDLLEARLMGLEEEALLEKLDLLGRLLGATKLMDMVLKDRAMVKRCASEFFQGRYSFSAEG